MRRAVFLDRDGVINERRHGYVNRPDQLLFCAGAAAAVARLWQAGWPVFLASNQGGVGKGFMTAAALREITRLMVEVVRASGGDFTHCYYCQHHPEAGCACRKPKPGMLWQAASDFGLDLRNSYMVGDMATDILCGKAASTRTILVESSDPVDPACCGPDWVVANLWAAVDLILSRS